ncbi:mitochondrial inner membrane protein required for protein import [Savitreella phatthalungensis]
MHRALLLSRVRGPSTTAAQAAARTSSVPCLPASWRTGHASARQITTSIDRCRNSISYLTSRAYATTSDKDAPSEKDRSKAKQNDADSVDTHERPVSGLNDPANKTLYNGESTGKTSSQTAASTESDAAAEQSHSTASTGEQPASETVVPPQQDPELLNLLKSLDGGSSANDDDGARRPSNGGNRSDNYKSSADIKRERTFNVFAGLSVVGLIGGILYLGRETEDSEVKGYSPGAWWSRVKRSFTGQMDYYTEPAFEKLLPDPLPEPYQRRYTLVLDLDDLLIHSEWTRERGWRTAKRPGLDYFLSYLSQYYEIVVFTNQYAGTALPVVQKLDPYRSSLSASLFRESAKYEDGKFIKDLSYMNRPLERIILIDTNPDAASKQPENAILLKPWHGETGPNSNARDLINLLPFLEYVAAVEAPDVRSVLKSYAGTDIAAEYMRREDELRAKIAATRSSSKSSGFFGGAGGKNARLPDGRPEIFMDQQRARAQKAHAEYMQYLRDNGEKMLAEEKQREEEMLKEMKTSLVDYFTKGAPQPPGQSQQQQ